MDRILIVNDQEAVLVSTDTAQTIVTGLMGPPGRDSSNTISESQDVDNTELTNGATLVYRASDAKWKATNLLDNQILEAGQF